MSDFGFSLVDFVKNDDSIRAHARSIVQLCESPLLLVPKSMEISFDLLNEVLDCHLGDYSSQKEEICLHNGLKGKLDSNAKTVTILWNAEVAPINTSKMSSTIKITGVSGSVDIGMGVPSIRWIEIADIVRYPGCSWGFTIEEPGSPTEVRAAANPNFGNPIIVPDSLASFVHEFGGVAAERVQGMSADSASLEKSEQEETQQQEQGQPQEQDSSQQPQAESDRVLHDDDDDDDDSGSSTVMTYSQFTERIKRPECEDLLQKMKKFVQSALHVSSIVGLESEVHNFIDEMENLIRSHPAWSSCSNREIDNAREGVEKFVSVKIYPKVFAKLPEDLKNDEQLGNRIEALQFVLPEHLDIPKEHQNDISWRLAQEELRKMSDFKSPKDKMVCVLNCCRVINNQLTTAKNGVGADEFLPLLIFMVLKANPTRLYSQLHYISRYRHPRHMTGEQAYFFTNMVSAVAFIEGIDSTSLTIDPDFFKSQMQQFHRGKANRKKMLDIHDDLDGEVVVVEPSSQSSASQSSIQSSSQSSSLPASSSSSSANVNTTNNEAVSKGKHRIKWTGRAAELIAEADKYSNDVEVAVTHTVEGKLSSLPAFGFVGRSAGDIRIGEIPQLLSSYHKLAALVEQLAIHSYVKTLTQS